MKTVIVDFNNISMARLFSKQTMVKDKYDVESINYDVWKFLVFDSLYYYTTRFKADEIIVAVDDRHSWRKIYFPKYKDNRPKFRNMFNIDWTEFHKIKADFTTELKENLPFKILEVSKCEGDDIIGTIALKKRGDNIIIVSSDKDFLQLCRKGLKVFSIRNNQEISHPNPEIFLQESSLMGQQKDNIFNVLTPLDYPDELRKPPFGKKKAEKFLIQGLKTSLNQTIEYKRKYISSSGTPMVYFGKVNLKERYDINRNLMDFSKIPKVLKKLIVDKYNNYVYPEPENIYSFIKKYNWPKYVDNFTVVENNLFNAFNGQGEQINV